MAAGTGEAPCAVVGHGDRLWVSSWGDNRIERYALEPKGASWISQTEVAVQGDASFRPAGMAVAPDGSIYITDWVDRSYPVHGKGRLWRLSRKTDAPPVSAGLPERSKSEDYARRLLIDPDLAAEARFKALGHDDPFIRQSALTGLINSNQLSKIKSSRQSTPLQRASLLAGWRWLELTRPDSLTDQELRQWIEWGLADESDQVVIAAIRWASERDRKEHLPEIIALLDRPEPSTETFAAVIASIAYLQTGSAAGGQRDPAREKLLIEFAANSSRSATILSSS